MSLKVFLTLAVLLGAGIVSAQSLRQQTYRDLSQLETVIALRGSSFFIMGKGLLWSSLERLLLEKLKNHVEVKVLTGERDAASFSVLARAGAQVRTLPGSLTTGPMLAGDLLIGKKTAGEYSVIDSSELVGIVKA